jgi:hypothetical protein
MGPEEALALFEANPYNASRHYVANGYWVDHFVKNGEVVWLVFHGDRFLAQVQNEQQAKNVFQEFRLLQDLLRVRGES